jgi:hypothetical protein
MVKKIVNARLHDLVTGELIAAQDMGWIGSAYSEMGLKGQAKAAAGMTDHVAQEAGAKFLRMASEHRMQAGALAKVFDMKLPKLDARQKHLSDVPLNKTAIKRLMAREWNSARGFAAELTNMEGWGSTDDKAMLLNDARHHNLRHHLWLKNFATGKVKVGKLELEKFAFGIDPAFGIEPGVVEAIYILNSKGYLTSNSCQGHVNERGHGYMQPYIQFVKRQDFPKLPGSKWFVDQLPETSSRYPFKPLTGARSGFYSWLQFGSPFGKEVQMTEAQFVQARKELLAWAKALPKAK